MAKRSLTNLSEADLQRELRRRERMKGRVVERLHRKRATLMKQITALDAEIARHGGTVRGMGVPAGRKRFKNDSNLADALVKTLKNATMSVTEVAAAVQKNGYKTTSPNFRTIVNQTLIKDKRIKRVGRGKYTAR
jgi:hypothetical protein